MRTECKGLQPFGEVTQCEGTLISRETTAEDVMSAEKLLNTERIAEFIPPSDDVRVIAGEGIMAIEFLEQAEALGQTQYMVTLGGTLSGCAVAAAKEMRSGVIVVGAEPLNANDAQQSFRSKHFVDALPANPIAHGLLTSLRDYTFPLILKHVYEMMIVTEDQIMYVVP